MSGGRADRRSERAMFPVSVIFEYLHPGTMRGNGTATEVVGIIAGAAGGDGAIQARRIRSAESGDQYLWSGFRLHLYTDQAESYYANLMGESPSVFVISRPGHEDRLEPCLITLSYDEASAHMEVEDRVDTVAIPPEVYRWVEAFVLEHYVPERKQKRKRENWKKDT